MKRFQEQIVLGVSLLVAVSAASAQTTWYVDDSCVPPGDGSAGDPFCTLQEGIDAAGNGDVVQAEGVFPEAIDFLGKAITVRTDNPASRIDATGLDASVVTIVGAGPGAVLEGFIIYAGTGTYDPDTDGYQGGGIYIADCSPTIRVCRVEQNTATSGGGIYVTNGSPLVVDCWIEGNAASFGGGLRAVAGSGPTITGCTFNHNTGGWGAGIDFHQASGPTVIDTSLVDSQLTAFGGGIRAVGTTGLEVRGCTFLGNLADQGAGMFIYETAGVVAASDFVGNQGLLGGGIVNYQESHLTVFNCRFTDNTASSGAGIWNMGSSELVMINCSVTDNTAGVTGGGLWNISSHAVVRNSILWANPGGSLVSDDGGTAAVIYSDVEGGHPGAGNIDQDPQFADILAGDLHLTAGSPGIDAGHNWAIVTLATTDLDGHPRLAADGADFDPGCGIPCVVDMGAYEAQGQAFDVIWGDIDGDGVAGVIDFLYILADWGECADGCCLSDLDLDGTVNVIDFLIVLATWT
ncbi:MAG: right-handed parallel beta-helix repeat-containing protein [Planctomycetota bacterium]|jgi:predicted outer membrane repeat protein